ncbi:nuclear transport factor 2 family protein [Rhodococcus rhodnii]|uniref:SnoaL-like domain-containing protein n=2 Tax=Rhodococcus rhodnii TaxID=38312 RepID=R7WQC4_9NOCA|nr:nuclear transport factor 2 family protein [Rhodococcus rhodnii]EOM77470.1 hypothetical protein Rrhod_1147 [Rhodococcus rhodnii LMG 5362]TXG90345.1 nuclear transport factor 2 family protein [Rhodococcus rhodnii]
MTASSASPAASQTDPTERLNDLERRLADVERQLGTVEDTLAITRLMTAYGPAVDAGCEEAVADLWTEDGVYDIDTGILRGHDEIAAMVRSQGHRNWIDGGCGHVLEPGHIRIDGDTAVATCKSQLIAYDGEAFRVQRVTASRWEMVKRDGQWKVTRRVGRILDGRADARELLATGVG